MPIAILPVGAAKSLCDGALRKMFSFKISCDVSVLDNPGPGSFPDRV